MRRPTVEWQVQGACNYRCSYCIQSPASRTGRPTDGQLEGFLRFFAALPGAWEIKMSGGEPFAHPAFLARIVPGLVGETPHRISVLTNLSADRAALERFAALTRGRLGIVSASLHLEHVAAPDFIARACQLRACMDPAARLVVNAVLVPGRLAEVARAAEQVVAAGLTFFPQLMKTKDGRATYPERERSLLARLVGADPTPRDANLAPSYRGRRCHAGVDYFVLSQAGEAWSCRTARRHGAGHLGNALDGSFRLAAGPQACAWEICPCTVPANRGMIDGIGRDGVA